MATTSNRKPGFKQIEGSQVFVFDGSGNAQKSSLNDLSRLDTDGKPFRFIWVHLNRMNAAALQWLKKSGIDQYVYDALTADETRPRCTVHGDGVIVNLRGVNLDPAAEPEDMVSIRLWIENKRVISLGLRPLAAVHDLIDAIREQRAPDSPGDLVARLALRLADRIDPTVAALNEQIDDIEDQVIDDISEVSRPQLADIRRTAIVLRRYMFPQRDALTSLEIEAMEWLSNRDRSHVREATERMTRLSEELDAIRDRAQVVHDQIMDSRAERMNRQMLVLAIVAALFLPLGLITGLLGINVGGIPGAGYHWAFWIVCGLLVAIGALQIWLFKRIGLF